MIVSEKVSSAGDEVLPETVLLGPGLRAIRRKRWYLWVIILLYLPLMSAAMKVLPSFTSVMYVFGIWFLVMFVIALVAAVVRCPRCGNYFHLHGMTLLYLRKCLHCQLHLCEDKKN